MSLKFRLNLMITALLALMMLIGMLMLIFNARQQVLAEVESTATLATHLLGAETIFYSGVITGELYHQPYQLNGLEHLRHLRIEFYNAEGHLIDSNRPHDVQQMADAPPAWFSYLMTVALPKQVELRRPLKVNSRQVGELAIIPDPSYEVAEIWHDTLDLFLLCVVFFLAVNALVYWAVGRALRPVDNILKALEALERGNLEARLPLFRLPELDRISHKFNRMAQTLEQSIGSNRKLSQQLITLQEAERKSLARDLHDEMGQYLTAINVDAGAILAMSHNKVPAVAESAQAIMDVSRQVIALISTMLLRLRPDALDGIGLKPALDELIMTWRQRNRGITCIVRIADDLQGLDDATKITIYRVVQECLTNVARHAHARRLEIKMGRLNSNNELDVILMDDGVGFDQDQSEGFGLGGMRERVRGVGGYVSIESSIGQGTRMTARFPLTDRPQHERLRP